MGRRRKTFRDYLRGSSIAHAYSLPRKPPFICQVVLPPNLTDLEARRICAFIKTLAVDFKVDK